MTNDFGMAQRVGSSLARSILMNIVPDFQTQSSLMWCVGELWVSLLFKWLSKITVITAVSQALRWCSHFDMFLFQWQLSPSLDTDTAIVLGQGNVAIDVARMLLAPVDMLRVSALLSGLASCYLLQTLYVQHKLQYNTNLFHVLRAFFQVIMHYFEHSLMVKMG